MSHILCLLNSGDVLNAILKPHNLDYRVEEGLITIVPRQGTSPTP
jgi:hypothetical protein